MGTTTFSGPVVSTNGFVGSFTGGTENLALTGTLAVDGTSTLTGAVSAPAGVTGPTTGAHNGTLGAGTPAAATVTTLTATGVAQLTNAANVLVIPTTDPGVENALWLDGTTIKVSAGS